MESDIDSGNINLNRNFNRGYGCGYGRRKQSKDIRFSSIDTNEMVSPQVSHRNLKKPRGNFKSPVNKQSVNGLPVRVRLRRTASDATYASDGTMATFDTYASDTTYGGDDNGSQLKHDYHVYPKSYYQIDNNGNSNYNGNGDGD